MKIVQSRTIAGLLVAARVCTMGIGGVSCCFAQVASSVGTSASAASHGNGKEYFADVVQVDGTKKRVLYFRDKEGSIIPPEVVDGKLVDGSDAPLERVRARIAQRRILVQYDKNAQIALAMVGDKDLIRDANVYSRSFLDKVEEGKPVSREELRLFLYHSSIGAEAGWKAESRFALAKTLAQGKFGMSTIEFDRLLDSAQLEAKQDWRRVTGALN